MAKPLFYILILYTSLFSLQSCNNKNTSKPKVIKNVNSSFFLTDTKNVIIQTIDCTLTDGTQTKCYEITTKSVPTDHSMGPWCPNSITDTADKSGKWFKDGIIYNADGSFFKNMAILYEDDKWVMHDENGVVFKTSTKDDCVKLAGAQLLDEFTNFCIECLPEYVEDITKSYKIPITPVTLTEPTLLNPGRPKDGPPNREDNRPPPPKNNDNNPSRGKRGRGPTSRGIAFNGVVFDAPAPLHLILAGYTIPPFDNAGGHINLDAGYHYHAATGITKEIKQKDGHSPMIGYAMDGFGLYAQLNSNGQEPNDLDSCRGHYDILRGYHYHVDAAGNNNFINCFSGATAR